MCLLSYLEHKKLKNMNEFVEIIRRLHTPHYEEARRHFHAAEGDGLFEGENEITRYLQNTLKTVIKDYGSEG